jgi:TFIIF-interacting CTD phosphatase-like protein
MCEPDSNEYFQQGFYKRPYLIECLKSVNKNFEVAVFTAGYDWYANPIIDRLDPTGKLI